jgi:hypothetical protein
MDAENALFLCEEEGVDENYSEMMSISAPWSIINSCREATRGHHMPVADEVRYCSVHNAFHSAFNSKETPWHIAIIFCCMKHAVRLDIPFI